MSTPTPVFFEKFKREIKPIIFNFKLKNGIIIFIFEQF